RQDTNSRRKAREPLYGICPLFLQPAVEGGKPVPEMPSSLPHKNPHIVRKARQPSPQGRPLLTQPSPYGLKTGPQRTTDTRRSLRQITEERGHGSPGIANPAAYVRPGLKDLVKVSGSIFSGSAEEANELTREPKNVALCQVDIRVGSPLVGPYCLSNP